MNWNIKGCSPQCANCKKEWKDKEEYHCLLFLLPEGPRRDDYCLNCWGSGMKDGSRRLSVSSTGMLQPAIETKPDSYWKGRFKEAGARPAAGGYPGPAQSALEEPLLLRALKKWLNSEERLHQCFCYIIALLLERNRYFRRRPSIKKDGVAAAGFSAEGGSARGGSLRSSMRSGSLLVYEDRTTGETYILEDPNLTLAELTTIETPLLSMLKQELT